ncbi:MAG TPA: hypothetical protein VL947_06140 [Cytophagales bacterium]|nr:hypothetical protein [Cytophagales bacterium]
MKLFTTGFLQVFFVAVNTFFIAKGFSVGVVTCGFLISFIWSYNVKKISIGTLKERVLYSSGAGTGSLLGMWTSQYMYIVFLLK